ncbi:MAG: hypothetical protein WB780_10375 [Candidatus Acidiferrales bacterium]
MAARQCPNCLAMIPAGKVVAYSNDLVCPGCQRPLEISDFSRNLAAFAALAAAFLVWWLAAASLLNDTSALGWVLPVVYSYFALSIVAPIALILLADLRLKSVDATPVHHEVPAPHSPH